MTKTKLTTRSLVGVLTGNTLVPKIMLTSSKNALSIDHIPNSLKEELRQAFTFKRPWVRVSYATIEVIDVTKHAKND